MAPRTILHLDMDAFYASVEQRDFPEYRGRPVVVGGDPRKGSGRGVVATASYEARRFGIHSAMPVSRACRLCPTAAFLPPRFSRYEEISGQVFEIMREFSPVMETLSLDEAYLDITESLELFGGAEKIGREIKSRIADRTGLTASVGIGTSKFIAKVCSELKKPDGFCICPAGQEVEFLSPLSVSMIRGIGKKTMLDMNLLAIRTIGDLARKDPVFLQSRFGAHGVQMWNLANGKDESPVQKTRRKSLGEERTFDADISDREILDHKLLETADSLSRSAQKLGWLGKTIVLKIRFSDFTTCTRRITVPVPTSDASAIVEQARSLMKEFSRDDRPVRLLGITLTSLQRAQEGQLFLFQSGVSSADRIFKLVPEGSRKMLKRAALLIDHDKTIRR